MPGPESLGPALPGSRAWRISLALLFCFAVVVSALHTVLQGFGWWLPICLIVLAVLGAAALTRVAPVRRSARPRRWLPTLAATAVLLGLLTLFFSARTAVLFVIPTGGTLSAFGELAQSGGLSISGQSVPAEVTVGIMFLLCLGIGAIAIVADLIAVTLRLPALAGIPLLVVLAIPAAIGIALSDAFSFVLAAVGYLVLLRAGQPLKQTGRSVGLGAVAVAVAVILPLVFPPVQESEATNSAFGGYVAGVNPVLNLGAELRREAPRTVLDYHTESGSAHYLRLVSLQNLTAETWAPDPAVIDDQNRPARVGPPPGLSAEVAFEVDTTWVDVNNLGSPWLPVPYPATSVSGLAGNWFWDAEALTFTSPDRKARGEAYRVKSLEVQPTPSQLSAAGTVGPNGFEKYLELPENMPAIIADTARQVVAGSESNYASAVSLQEYFRDGGFAYSETAPVDEGYDGTGMEVLAEFLFARTGYCVHFASAMAVMARTLGIPSRVAVGFLPGTREDQLVDGMTSYRVTTRDVHTWPELYFDGIGWIRFEPTPGRGFVPTYADEAAIGVPDTPNVTAPEATPTPTPTPTRSGLSDQLDRDTETGAQSGGGPGIAGLWIGLAVLALLLVLLVPAIVRALQRAIRMRRLANGSPLASTGWRELLQTAEDLRVGIDHSNTPRQAARLISQAVGTGEAAGASLAAALDVVERQSFGRSATVSGGMEPAAQVNRVIARLRAGAGFRARLRAAIAPPSIWSGIVDWFSGSAPADAAATTRSG